MNILELYSGIGGMHMALNESEIQGKIVAAVEISTLANSVYLNNFPNTLLLNKNIQSLTAEFINSLNINAIFMSPPCQPFTRNGLKKDELDNRTCSFSHIIDILPDLKVKYILMENVKGFETSIMRNKFINTLNRCEFVFQEFILTPTQFGISNTRHRYYCIAKKKPLSFNFPVTELKDYISSDCSESELFPIETIIEENINIEQYLIPENLLLKYAMLLDICNPKSKRSCCFTKAYGKFIEGTGSVFSTKSQEEINNVYNKLKLTNNNSEFISCINDLELRFFTPTEIGRLMSFPNYFNFPKNLTSRQQYKLLGNSINVKVVSKLIKLLNNNAV